MKRGELYLVRKPGSQDPQKRRESGIDQHLSAYNHEDTACDELVSLPKTALTHCVGFLRDSGLKEMDRALAVALGLEESWPDFN